MKAVLFDLDGTLLPADNEIFINQYLKLLARKVAPYLSPEIFLPQLLASTAVMIAGNDGAKTNEAVFVEDFFHKVDVSQEILMPVFEDFYTNDYKQLIQYTNPTAISKEIVETLVDKGYRMVLATNPVFPRIAVIERLSWLKIDPEVFELITAYENMHFCKPNVKYYEEILARLQLPGTECLMVGNDVQEDLVASTLGMNTFLVTDYLIDRSEGDYSTEYQGSLNDLKQFILDAF